MNRSYISNFNKARRDKFLVWAILISFLAMAVLTVVVSENEYLWKKLVVDPSFSGPVFNGDLYGMSLIKNFKDNIQLVPVADDATGINNSKYIAKGDSFFATNFDSPPVNNFLQDNLAGGVYFHSYPVDPLPLDFLKLSGAQKGQPKVFIWETAEFYSVDRAASADESTIGQSNGSRSWAVNLAKNLLAKLKPNRARFEFFVENNRLVEPIRAWMKNESFKLFGDIDGQTPLYSTNPNMLFISDDLTFLQDNNNIARIPQLADSIAALGLQLKQQYNITLLYIVVPDKISIYGDTLPSPQLYAYNNYIPLLEQALAQRGVQYVDVYGAMVKQKQSDPTQLLYYPGDHHYTPLGKNILEKQLIEKLQNLPVGN